MMAPLKNNLLQSLLMLLMIGFMMTTSLTAQHSIQWQNCYGGSADEFPSKVITTNDNGIVSVGFTRSYDGNVSGMHALLDVWLMKTDSAGLLLWQKCLGGFGDDYGTDVIQTSDGGYAISGASRSRIGADVSLHIGDTTKYDYWIVKVDTNGIIQWQKTYGGTENDVAYSIKQTVDGGYIVVGSTSSNNIDVTGFHGGSTDCWVLKLDATGNLVWQKTLGGTGNDEAYSVIQANDGNYVVAGYTISIDGDVTGNNGNADYWVVKLDINGIIIWQHAYGGSNDDRAYSIIQTSDGGFAAAGYSKSIDGNVSGNQGSADYWLLKLDAAGAMQWQKTYGGTANDEAYSVIQCANGHYALVGKSSSIDGNVSANHGGYDYWFIETDNAGAILWQHSFGGKGVDEALSVTQTADLGFIIAGGTQTSSNGNVGSNNGNYDFWLVKLSKDSILQTVVANVLNNTICAGSTLTLPYIVSNSFGAGNVFYAQLSDLNGNFSNPSIIGSNASTVSGSISITIPPNVPIGIGYRMRIVSTNPWMEGHDNSFNISISSLKLTSPAYFNQVNISCYGFANGIINTNPTDGFPPYSYQWSPSISTLATVSNLSVGSYSLTVTDAFGCSRSNSATIGQPTPILTGAPVYFNSRNATCFGSNNGIINTNFTGGNAPYTYLWTPTGATTSTVSNLSSGSYTVVVTDVNGCTNSNNATIGQPSQILVGAPSHINSIAATCYGYSNGIVNTNFSGGTPPYSYAWTPTGATTSTISNLLAGTYTIVVTDANGCSRTTSQLVTQPTQVIPVINANRPTSFCIGDSVILDAGIYSSYMWSNGSSSQYLTAHFSGIYSVTVTNAAGCTGSASRVVTANSNPTPIITSGPTTICQGNSVILNAGNYSIYHWNNNSTTQTLTVTSTGNYSVTVTNGNGCTGTAAQSVVVNSNPTTNIITSGPPSFCVGDSVILDAGVFQSYIWSSGATTEYFTAYAPNNYIVTITDNNGCTGTASQVVIVFSNPTPFILGGPTNFCQGDSVILDAGNYSSYIWNDNTTNRTLMANTAGVFFVTVTNSNGCTGTDSKVVIVNPNPTPVISGSPTTFCQGNSVNLNAGSYSFYHWNNNSTSQILNANTSGTYSVTVTNSNNCTGTAAQTITVNPNPSPVITGSPTTFCQGDSIILDAGNYSTYHWNNSSTYQTLTANTPGTYSVTVTNSNNCTGTASQTVVVNPPPTPVIAGSPTTFCQGDSVILNAGNYSNFLWNDNSTNQTLTATGSGTYSVTVTNSNNCTGTAAQTVTVNPLPAIPTITLIGNQLQSSSIFGNQWYYNNVILNGDTNQVLNPPQDGNYTVIVTDSNGCTNTSGPYNFFSTAIGAMTDFIGIHIYPNPNNGNFTLTFNQLPKASAFQIVDVFGQVVYETNISSKESTYTISNSYLNGGIYFWQILSNKQMTANGKLVILK